MGLGVDVIFYIHGRGFQASTSEKWQAGLALGLDRAGYPSVAESARHVPIKYSALLDPAVTTSESSPPPVTAPGRTTKSIAEYRERERALDSLIGPGFRAGKLDGAVQRVSSSDKVAEAVIGQRFRDVKRYVTDDQRRNAILLSVIDQVISGTEPDDRCVLIGHSLGSIVALDLLRHWPANRELHLLLTLGSPASLGPMRSHLHDLTSVVPCHILEGWVNVYDPSDAVTGGSGLQPYFGEDVVDHRVENGSVGDNHGVRRHLEHITVGRLLGRALQPPTPGSTPVAVPEDVSRHAWFDAALACWFRNQLVEKAPPGSSRRARRLMAREHLRVDAGRLAGLWPEDDLADHLREVAPEDSEHADLVLKTQIPLLDLQPFAPFDVSVDPGEQFDVSVRLAQYLGWPTQRMQNVRNAFEQARAAQKVPQNRARGTVTGLAAVALVGAAATGVGLLAAPGLVGAAAMASGLATLGGFAGGGMAAGLYMVAGLGAGGSYLATVAMNNLSSVQLSEEVVLIHVETLVHRWEGRSDQAATLIATLESLRRQAEEQERLHATIDDDRQRSDTVKEWGKKTRILEAALVELRP